MAAKKVKIADVSSGSTFNTLPGNTADMTRDGSQIDDTIFGQLFQSNQPGLINWGVTSNALYRGFAGYVADLKRSSDTSSGFTDEAMTNVSGNTWKITDATKNLWDRGTTATFKDGTSGSPAIDEADILERNYLLGQVTFSVSKTDPTCSGDFFSLTTFAKANSFSVTQTADTIDVTAFEDAQANSGFNLFNQTLLQVQIELTGFYQQTNLFHQLLIDREEIIIELNPDGGGLSFCRGFFKAVTDSQTGDVGGTEMETTTFALTVPEGDGLAAPFQWQHDGASTLSVAIQELLDSWEAQAEVQVQYLPDGSTGYQGNAVVTDISLSGGVDVMNEFSVSLQGTGAITAI